MFSARFERKFYQCMLVLRCKCFGSLYAIRCGYCTVAWLKCENCYWPRIQCDQGEVNYALDVNECLVLTLTLLCVCVCHCCNMRSNLSKAKWGFSQCPGTVNCRSFAAASKWHERVHHNDEVLHL